SPSLLRLSPLLSSSSPPPSLLVLARSFFTLHRCSGERQLSVIRLLCCAQTAKPSAPPNAGRLCLRPHTRAPFSCAAAFGVEPATMPSPSLRTVHSNTKSISQGGASFPPLAPTLRAPPPALPAQPYPSSPPYLSPLLRRHSGCGSFRSRFR